MNIIVIVSVLLSVIFFHLFYSVLLCADHVKSRGLFIEFKRRRKLIRAQKFKYEGVPEKQSFMDKMDILIERSAINLLIPFMTGELLLISAVSLSSAISYIVLKVTGFWLYPASSFVTILFFVLLRIEAGCKKDI